MSGFLAIPRPIFERAARLNPIGYKIGLELIVKCNCKKIREVPIHFADRKFGESKLRLREQINYLKHLKRLADFKYGGFSRFVQFCLVGLTGMFVDMAILGMLLNLQIRFLLARAIAIWVAMTLGTFFLTADSLLVTVAMGTYFSNIGGSLLLVHLGQLLVGQLR